MIEQWCNNIRFETMDITKADTECIVNAANRSLLGGGGVDGAIHRAAGPELLAECRALHGCSTGEAKITKGYRLNAQYVIHTVGPIYSGTEEDVVLLRDCYWNSLEAATEIALKTVAAWFKANSQYGMEVLMACYNHKTCEIYKKCWEKYGS